MTNLKETHMYIPEYETSNELTHKEDNVKIGGRSEEEREQFSNSVWCGSGVGCSGHVWDMEWVLVLTIYKHVFGKGLSVMLSTVKADICKARVCFRWSQNDSASGHNYHQDQLVLRLCWLHNAGISLTKFLRKQFKPSWLQTTFVGDKVLFKVFLLWVSEKGYQVDLGDFGEIPIK